MINLFHRPTAIAASALLAASFTTTSHASGEGGGFGTYDPTRHDRLTAKGTDNTNFWAYDYDLTGVSINSKAVLISDRHVVSAEHIGWSIGRKVTFRNRNGDEFEHTVEHIDRLKHRSFGILVDTDILVMRLNHPVAQASNIAAYPIPNSNEYEVIGQDLLVYGRGNTAGRNDLTSVTVFSANGAISWCIGFSFDTQDNGEEETFGDDEKKYVGGDSGSALFFDTPEGLVIAGAAFLVTVRESAATYLTRYKDQIVEIAERDNATLPATPVPNHAPSQDPLDLNQDGTVNSADIQLFVILMEAQDPKTDLDNSSKSDFFDLGLFIEHIAQQA